MAETVGQVICPKCGHIAKVNQRSNGQKLKYIVCKNKCYSGAGTIKQSQEIEGIMKPSIGEFGAKPGTEVKPPEISEQTTAAVKKDDPDWTPEPGEEPEALEGNTETTSENSKPKKSNFGKWAAGLGLLGAIAAGVGYALRKGGA